MITRRALLRASVAAPLALLAPAALAGAPVVAQGDSLSYGQASYAGLVAAWLGRPFVGLAIGGSGIREQAGAWLDAPAGLTISLCGYNDMRRSGLDAATLAAYELTLLGAAYLAMRRGPVALGGCLRMTAAGYAQSPHDADRGSDAAAAAYSAAVARVCRASGAVYVDVGAYDPATMTGPDLVHPTPAGYQWIADQFVRQLGRVYVPTLTR